MRNHKYLRLLLFVSDDGYDVYSIDLSWFGSSPKYLFVVKNSMLANGKIDVFHSEPLPSVYLPLLDNFAFHVLLFDTHGSAKLVE